jgi:hypothetical protein
MNKKHVPPNELSRALVQHDLAIEGKKLTAVLKDAHLDEKLLRGLQNMHTAMNEIITVEHITSKANLKIR